MFINIFFFVLMSKDRSYEYYFIMVRAFWELMEVEMTRITRLILYRNNVAY